LPYLLNDAMTPMEGNLLVSDADRFAIVVSRFNDLVTGRLLEGAVSALRRHGASEEQITVAWAPGSFELPIIADKFAATGKYSAILALGAVIQGETSHHDYINHATAQGLMQIGLKHGRPVLFGVLTCHSMEQALDRAGGKAGNKGAEAALAAIETVNLLRQCSV
jgi:6,7-dimethyl-8-ribityllumazine synthase